MGFEEVLRGPRLTMNASLEQSFTHRRSVGQADRSNTAACYSGATARRERSPKHSRGLIPLLMLSAALLLEPTPADASLSLRAPSGMPSGRTITAGALWEELNRLLPPGVWVSPLESEQYEVISAAWLRRTFLPSLRRQMRELWDRDLPIDDRAANCNGFALLCRTMLHLSAMDAGAYGPAAGTAIVRQDRPFGGLIATKEDHKVAFVLTDEGLWIIEAQSAAHVSARDYPNLTSVKLVSIH